MNKNTILMFIWGIMIIILIGLLSTIGFLVAKRSKDYKELEEKLAIIVKNSDIDLNRLNDGESIVTKEEMISLDLIEEKDMVVNKDVCDGYVKISFDKTYKYETYLKCKKYETKKSW